MDNQLSIDFLGYLLLTTTRKHIKLVQSGTESNQLLEKRFTHQSPLSSAEKNGAINFIKPLCEGKAGQSGPGRIDFRLSRTGGGEHNEAGAGVGQLYLQCWQRFR